MAKQVRTARGVLIDFDAIIIKNQMAQAPMNIEVASRKNFIDSKEGRARGQRRGPNDTFVTNEPTRVVVNSAPMIEAAPMMESVDEDPPEEVKVQHPKAEKKS
jgi:hypothetical protein